MDTLTVARSWCESGFSVIPVGFRSKRPAFDALKASGSVNDEGRPVWEPFKTRRPTDSELWQWFAGPRRNLGVVTGWAGLVVLDFDQLDAYMAWQAWAAAEGARVAAMTARTYRVYSSRGVHVYLIVDEPVESYQAPGVDVKAAWGYVLAPPSVHPSGHEYTSEGSTIARCERLADVFPFTAVMPAMEARDLVLIVDPWEAATRAVDCGGDGAVLRAKASLRIEDLLHLDSRRTRQTIICPLHNDHNPSMVVDLERQHFWCWGCGRHGDVLDLVAAMNRITVREAISQIARGE